MPRWWGRRVQAPLWAGLLFCPQTTLHAATELELALHSVPSTSQAGTPGHRAQPADTAPTADSGSLGCLEKPLTLYKLQLFVCF